MSDISHTQSVIPIDDAVRRVASGQPLRDARVTDLRALLEALEAEAPTVGKALECVHCTIGECACSNLKIDRPLVFTYCTFDKDAVFRTTVFNATVSFRNTTFENQVNFESASFHQNVNFSYSVIQGEAHFRASVFDRHVDFGSVAFKRVANFKTARFRQNAHFESAVFSEEAHFTSVTFMKESSFWSVIFGKTVDFESCAFGGNADFESVRFNCDAKFQAAVFGEKSIFKSAMVEWDLDFRKSSFRAACPLNVTNLILRPGARILLALDQIGSHQRDCYITERPRRRERLKRAIFRYTLPIRRAVRRQWPSVHLIDGERSRDRAQLKEAADQYNLLRDNYRSLPSAEMEEDRCHYKYKDLSRRAQAADTVWGRLCRFFEWAVYKWCLGYGIYAKRILIAYAVTIFLFAGIYWLEESPETIRGYDEGFNPLYFSVVTLTTIGFGDYAPQGYLRFFVCLEGILGLVLMSIFTVAFARKLIRM